MKRIMAVVVLAAAFGLGGCAAASVDATAPVAADGAALEQSKTTLLSIMCATRAFGDDAESMASAPDLDAFRAKAAEGDDLFTRSAASMRQPPSAWPAGTEGDVEAVAVAYDQAAELFRTLATFSELSELAAALERLSTLGDPGDAYGRLAATVGLSPDLAGECAARGT